MRNKALLLFLLALAGCGAAQPPPPPSTPSAPPPPPPPPHVRATVPGTLSVNCREDFPREDVPDEPVLFTSGDLTVRAQSLVVDFPGTSQVMFCVARNPLPEGAHLVVNLEDYGWSAGTWTGTAFVDPRVLEGSEVEDEDAPPPPRPVVLPGQTVTAVRSMPYCPTQPSQPCLAAGDFVTLQAMSSSDPNGPRSGWDFEEQVIRTSPARAARTPLSADACGLRVSLRGASECARATLAEVLECVRQNFYEEGDVDADDPELLAEMRAQRAVRIVFSDGAREVAVYPYGVQLVTCVEGVVLLSGEPEMFGSHRQFTAIETAAQHITRARGMSIRDHEESRVDCANAWDGVEFVPIVAGGALVGGVVRGAGRSFRFDVTRGDVGEAVFATSTSQDQEDPSDIPIAYRVTDAGLVRIDVGNSAPAPVVCPLRVSDEDGQTNVRPDPSTRGAPVGTIPTGTVIHSVEQRGRWYRIEQPHAGWLWSGSLSRRCAP